MAKEKMNNENPEVETPQKKGKIKTWLKDHIVGVIVGGVGVLTLIAAVTVGAMRNGQDPDALPEGDLDSEGGISEIPDGIPEL